jgi:tetratricopeptide (TPR) repeat protein
MTKKNTQTPREFIDAHNDDAMGAYYDLVDVDHDANDMRALIKKYPDFYDPYLQVADDMRSDGDEKGARTLEDTAFERAQKRILDAEDNWPDEMRWGFLENRHIIRALGMGADNLWKDGKTEKALDVYRKLLHCNLNDNIGARYAIIALRMGLSYEEYIDQVWPTASVPVEQIETWFKTHAPKFPEELEEWRTYCKDTFGMSEEYIC